MQPGRLIAFLVFVAALSVAPEAIAAETTTNSLNSIINLYRQNASKWEATLATYALTLFWILVAIDLTLTGIRLAVKAAEFGEWASELVNQILFIGFFFALLKNAPTWAAAIVNSFRTAASQAVVASGGTSLFAPSDVFSVGLALASKIYGSGERLSASISLRHGPVCAGLDRVLRHHRRPSHCRAGRSPTSSFRRAFCSWASAARN